MSKLTLFCMLISLMTVKASVFGQYNHVSLEMENATLGEILVALEKQAPIKFLYDQKEIEALGKINIKVKEKDLFEVLNDCLATSQLTYSLLNDVIIIKPKEEQNYRPQEERRTVSGTVKDAAGSPLPGVTVQIKGSLLGASTDADGKYSLRIAEAEKAVLVFSFVGMETQEITVNNRQTINVVLKTEVVEVDAVVVTGYQTLARDRVTGSYSTISGEILAEKPSPDLKWGLEGQVPGLTINKNGQIEIRGVSTFRADKTPLIVIDGYPVEDVFFDNNLFKYEDGVLENVNTDNIESITVLKDGVAASIYGSRAANGVIVIVSKKGRSGQPRVTYKGTYSVRPKPDLSNLSLANASDFIDIEIDMYNESPSNMASNYYDNTTQYNEAVMLYIMAAQGDITTTERDSRIAELRKGDFLKQVEKYLYRSEMYHQHNLNVTGGGEKSTYNLAINYMDTRGNFKGSNSNRLLIDLGNTWDFTKYLSFNANIAISYNKVKKLSLDPSLTGYTSGLFSWSTTSYWTPYTSLVNEDGTPATLVTLNPNRTAIYEGASMMKPWEYVPLEDINKTRIINENFQTRMNARFDIKPMDGLTIEVGGQWARGYNVKKDICDADSYTMRIAYNNATDKTNQATKNIPDGGMLDESRYTNESWMFRSQAHFHRDYDEGMHRIAALAGFEASKTVLDQHTYPSRLGYNSQAGTFVSINIADWNNGVNNYANAKLLVGRSLTLTDGSFSTTDNRAVSWYSNASYEYNNKYIVSGSIRWDLKNFFGTSKKYRYKPMWSIGGTWKLSDEDFFDIEKINRLHLRASYGVNGNIDMSMGPDLILNVGSYSAYNGGTSYSISSPPNDQLRWERTATTNIGVDFNAFNNRVALNIDYYYKNSTDVLAPNAMDPSRGVSSYTINAGRIVNNGIEVVANVDILRKNPLKWRAIGVFSNNKSEVKKYNAKKLYASSYAGTNPVQVEGYPVDGLWGYRFATLNDKGSVQVYNHNNELISPANATTDDVVYLGSHRPKFDISLTNRFSFKNWDLSFMFISKLGAKYRKEAFIGSNISVKSVGQRWKQTGDELTTIYPKYGSWNTDGFYFPFVDKLIGKADFLRLRDITLTYNIGPKTLQIIGISSAKVYIQARNLLTIKPGDCDIDPESFEYMTTTGTSPAFTYSWSSLPRQAEYYFGLSFTF